MNYKLRLKFANLPSLLEKTIPDFPIFGPFSDVFVIKSYQKSAYKLNIIGSKIFQKKTEILSEFLKG